MNKVYVAALYSMMPQAKAAAVLLEKAGYKVTSRWIHGDDPSVPPLARATYDLEDVRAADYLMLLSLPFGTLYKGGGRHVEFGYALALGKRMVVVGDYETVFIYLPEVRVYTTVGAAIHFMNEEQYDDRMRMSRIEAGE